jgi:transposase InsO family protein
VVIASFSRKVVAWAAGPTIHRELVLTALASAVKQRRPHGTIIHADQGVQSAVMHGATLRRHGHAGTLAAQQSADA